MSDGLIGGTSMVTALLLNEVRRTKQQFMSLSYRFQESRFRYVGLSDELRARLHPRPAATAHLHRLELPIYSFVKTGTGVQRMVRRARFAGSARDTNLRCWTDQKPEAVVLHAVGEVGLSTASDLANAIKVAFAQHRRVIVDLSHLDYLDVSGTHVLERTAARHHGHFVVVGSKPTIHKIFDILELTDVLPVVPSVEAAQEYLRTNGG